MSLVYNLSKLYLKIKQVGKGNEKKMSQLRIWLNQGKYH